MTKKVKVFLIALVVIIAGVGGYFIYNAQKAPSTEEKEITKETNKSSTKKVQGNGKTLVVYYSAQNHTKDVAQKVAENLGADLFEIEPKEKYTEDDLDWTDDDSRVTREHEDTSLRNVELKTTEVENWDQYDTVLIGYPIWWGIAAWPVDTFVKANDFYNKKVIPFCTSASSGLGESGTKLQKEAKGGNWQKGQRFSSSPSDSTIKDWTDSLK